MTPDPPVAAGPAPAAPTDAGWSGAAPHPPPAAIAPDPAAPAPGPDPAGDAALPDPAAPALGSDPAGDATPPDPARDAALPGEEAGRRLFRYVTGDEWCEYRAIMRVFAGTFFSEFTHEQV
ncbi:MAG TPA: hypothetical protein VFZ77_23325, partial [Acidimicrobiales bacterium]